MPNMTILGISTLFHIMQSQEKKTDTRHLKQSEAWAAGSQGLLMYTLTSLSDLLIMSIHHWNSANKVLWKRIMSLP